MSFFCPLFPAVSEHGVAVLAKRGGAVAASTPTGWRIIFPGKTMFSQETKNMW